MGLQICQMVYHHENCLNVKKPFAQDCQICVNACPHEALSKDHEISAQRCTECGLCVAACPSDGMAYRTAHQLEEYFYADHEEVILNCLNAQSEGLSITCLGLLDRDAWSTLVLLASDKKVSLLTGDCNACSNKPAFTEAIKVLEELYTDWPGHPNLKFYRKPAKEERNDKTSETAMQKIMKLINREQGQESVKNKELQLRDLRKRSIQSIKNLLSDENMNKAYILPITRRWLLRAMDANPQLKVPFRTLTATSECTSCGICVSICPQEALEKREAEGKQQLFFEPLKCVHCGRCIEICHPQALSLQIKLMSAKDLNGKILIREGVVNFCSKCGRQLLANNEQNLCPACSTNDHKWLDFFQG